MPALRFRQALKEILHFRFQCRGRECGPKLHRPAEFLRHVRHGQAAFALSAANNPGKTFAVGDALSF